jgi:hypothetical protein
MPAREHLTLPLLTLAGAADRSGEAHGLGALDPALARALAAAGARHPGSQLCLTITDQHGHAVGHGCLRPVSAGAMYAATNGAPVRSPSPSASGGQAAGSSRRMPRRDIAAQVSSWQAATVGASTAPRMATYPSRTKASVSTPP